MSGPHIPARHAQPFDHLIERATAGGWDDLERLLNPEAQPDATRPDDELMQFIYGFSTTVPGRAFFEWIFDNTIRQPLRVTGRSIEETALNAAVRQGVNGVAEMLLKAIAEGEQLVIKNRNGGGK